MYLILNQWYENSVDHNKICESDLRKYNCYPFSIVQTKSSAKKRIRYVSTVRPNLLTWSFVIETVSVLLYTAPHFRYY